MDQAACAGGGSGMEERGSGAGSLVGRVSFHTGLPDGVVWAAGVGSLDAKVCSLGRSYIFVV